MRYVGCALLGFALIVLASTALAYGLYSIAQIGVCADGPQAFEVQRRCPDGSTGLVLAMFVAFLVLGLGGILHANRGRPPGATREPAQITFLLLWVTIFGALAFASFWAVWGPAADPGGLTGTVGTTKPAAIFTGVLFGAMALGGSIPLALRLASREPGGGLDGGGPGVGSGSFEVPAARR